MLTLTLKEKIHTDEVKIKWNGKRIYPTLSVKYLGVKMGCASLQHTIQWFIYIWII